MMVDWEIGFLVGLNQLIEGKSTQKLEKPAGGF